MKIQLIAVGTKMPAWVETGYQEYARRMPNDMPLQLVEIPAGKRGKNADIARILKKEGEQTLAAIPKGNRIVTLEVTGKPWDTPQLAKTMSQWQLDGRDVSLLIGGPEGLAPECIAFRKMVAFTAYLTPSACEDSGCRKSLQRLVIK